MSILIKGMEMPSRCFSCPMCDVDCCGISRGSYIEYREVDIDVAMNGRPDDCPLIPVPPHGRLIDADALPWRKGKDELDRPCLLLVTPAIEALPTNIPAEEGEE